MGWGKKITGAVDNKLADYADKKWSRAGEKVEMEDGSTVYLLMPAGWENDAPRGRKGGR
jgi:hypothetical protein